MFEKSNFSSILQKIQSLTVTEGNIMFNVLKN